MKHFEKIQMKYLQWNAIVKLNATSQEFTETLPPLLKTPLSYLVDI